ncbi:MAG: ThuA domain-containing protein [Bacteroidales bacterium]
MKSLSFLFSFLFLFGIMVSLPGQSKNKIVGFYNSISEQAHTSFVNEANKWFSETFSEMGYNYDSTSNWDKLNDEYLKDCKLVIFINNRPEKPIQRSAFEKYMNNGGAWMGFHFAGFALTPSDFPQDWDWYHNIFLGSGQYKSNTWRPTSAILKIEQKNNPITQNLPSKIVASPNEWYCWEKDLTKNSDIIILCSIDSLSFPLGTGPKKHEIWYSGYYPVVWTNKNFRMVYFNMGHNDIDFEVNKELSNTFGNEPQDQLILNTVNWLIGK